MSRIFNVWRMFHVSRERMFLVWINVSCVENISCVEYVSCVKNVSCV